jgi:hypothetical protein
LFSDVHDYPVAKEGYLKVQSEFGQEEAILTRWQERYFTLQGYV